MKKGTVSLRKFPYPYRAALAVCNDIDYMNGERFMEIHSFLSSHDKGLGLEIGDSFWMYAPEDDLTGSFSYFRGVSDEPSYLSGLIEKMIVAGYIDCLHTYGNFSQYPGFSRQLAQKAVNLMKEKRMGIRVWTNHGNMLNLQNIGLDNACGDIACIVGADGDQRDCWQYEKSIYHTDITGSAGMRYVWINSLTEIVGQGRRCGIMEAVFSCLDGCKPGKSFLFRCIQLILTAGCIFQKKIKIKIISESFRKKFFRQMYDGNNEPVKVVTLRDGQKVYSFTRYGRFGVDGADAMECLLSEKTLKRLKAKRGYMIIFTHLAKQNNTYETPFSPSVCEAFRRLSQENRDGNIYVTTTSKLLRYYTVTKHLVWQVKKEHGRTIIQIDNVNDPVFGEYVPNEGDLQGVTFYVPDAGKTEVCIGSRQVEIDRNLPDSTGWGSVSFPLVKMVPFEQVCRDIQDEII